MPRDVQAQLSDRGQHRGPSVPDLLIAAPAELADLTVLHDRGFGLIAEITGQPVERLAAGRGAHLGPALLLRALPLGFVDAHPRL